MADFDADDFKKMELEDERSRQTRSNDKKRKSEK